MSILILSLVVTGGAANIQPVVNALGERDCPKLFAMYADSMKEAFPASETAKFCNSIRRSIGPVQSTESIGREGAWHLFLVKAEKGSRTVKVAWDPSGKIAGFAVTNPPPDVSEVKNTLGWPMEDESLVYWGGDTKGLNNHVDNHQQRRAIDLCMVGQDGRTYSGNGTANKDYFIYGKPVMAVADGKVLIVVDGVPDNEPGDMNPYLAPGNVVVVEHTPGEYAHYAHLVPKSVRVKPGDKVRRGQQIGLVGNSGNSSEPHLHFHIQDSPKMPQGYGLALVFGGVSVNRQGKITKRQRGYRPLKGDLVRPE